MSRVLVNGWLNEQWHFRRDGAAMCGVHIADETAFRRANIVKMLDFPVGSRDPSTHELFFSNGVPSEMIGCATLTLPRYEGRRSGTIWTDSKPQGKRLPPFLKWSHKIPVEVAWEAQLAWAKDTLEMYRLASKVFTSRLHVLLPCIAFGTPVALTHIPPNEERRFSLAKYLGVEVGTEPKVYDTSELAGKFRAFTLKALNRLSPP